MEPNQIIYPTERLLANPKLFIAIANHLGGPDWDTYASATYELLESIFTENDDVEPDLLICTEVCFREKPEEPDTFQVILSNGDAIEIRPDGDEYVSAIKTEEDLGVVSAIYGRLVKALEDVQPDLKGDIALVDPPTPSNGYLRHEDGNSFRGAFHLLSDPDKIYNFIVDIVNLDDDDLRARITPQI